MLWAWGIPAVEVEANLSQERGVGFFKFLIFFCQFSFVQLPDSRRGHFHLCVFKQSFFEFFIE